MLGALAAITYIIYGFLGFFISVARVISNIGDTLFLRREILLILRVSGLIH